MGALLSDCFAFVIYIQLLIKYLMDIIRIEYAVYKRLKEKKLLNLDL